MIQTNIDEEDIEIEIPNPLRDLGSQRFPREWSTPQKIVTGDLEVNPNFVLPAGSEVLPLHVIAVCGLYRGGKSFLLNNLAGSAHESAEDTEEGRFAVGDSVQACI